MSWASTGARSFYPTVLIVITSYSVLFAAMGGIRQILLVKIVVATGILAVAVLDSRKYSADPVALIGHGLFDFVHRFVIDNRGVHQWWPGFCPALDLVVRAWLAMHCSATLRGRYRSDKRPLDFLGSKL